MEMISYMLARTGQIHEENASTPWGYPEGLMMRKVTTSPGSSAYFQIRNGTPHVIQIRKKCILHLDWMQAISSDTKQTVKVLLRDQYINFERTINANEPDILTLNLNINYSEDLNPPYDLILEVVHSQPIRFLECQRLDLTVLVDL